jgi:hypothetical protein
MTGMFEFDWWRVAAKALTDEQLEQVTSGLGNELARNATQQAFALRIMHDEALGELGRRSRAEDARRT